MEAGQKFGRFVLFAGGEERAIVLFQTMQA